MARICKDQGRGYFSADHIGHILRFNLRVFDPKAIYQVNNDYLSSCSRRFKAKHKALGSFLRTRKTTEEKAETAVY